MSGMGVMMGAMRSTATPERKRPGRRKVFGYGGTIHVWLIVRRLRKRGWRV